jgi:hypothetical protein
MVPLYHHYQLPSVYYTIYYNIIIPYIPNDMPDISQYIPNDIPIFGCAKVLRGPPKIKHIHFIDSPQCEAPVR